MRRRAEPHQAILRRLFGDVWTPSCMAYEASEDAKWEEDEIKFIFCCFILRKQYEQWTGGNKAQLGKIMPSFTYPNDSANLYQDFAGTFAGQGELINPF